MLQPNFNYNTEKICVGSIQLANASENQVQKNIIIDHKTFSKMNELIEFL